MNANTLTRACLRGVAPAAATLMLIGIAGNAAAADDMANKKLTRQIGVMEKIVDEVLLDSPNFLVYSKQNTHGIYLDEFGMLFSFEASILTKSSENWWKELQSGLGKKFNIRRENGKTIIEYEDGDEDKSIDVDDSDWEEKMEAEQKERFEAGKEELVTVLLDYGDTLTGLRDAQTVAIAAFLRRGDFYFDDGVSTLVVKAKMSDLRAFAKGDLSRSAMQDRISYQEY